ncbi:hypothetical protein CkaCkLH20_02189 [Colletotrichum karsti]|uniref:Ecp2 effector protein-like domain-containing protein n=1 Tax=Colletotrichum karsti TaxID=1095194 RepID=A0A9P6ICR0_9PEZI|nr:uncharacterized protein CkaCkLH20_02189 [Colletotrichum karsti]KAF9880235.1 hypothetical protein CkaCkLH20_02189 [Colletotrichum karsti]
MAIHQLKGLLCWVTALSFAALAAGSPLPDIVPRALTNSDGTPSTLLINRNLQFTQDSEAHLAKRFPFSAGRDEWCGEVAEDPATDFSASAPLAADCAALVSSLNNQNGFWTLQPGDFGTGGEWARVAGSGTCSFAARYADAGSAASPVRIGTNDIRFYANRYAVLERDGKLGLQGTVQCNNDERMVFVTWGFIRS